MKSLRPLLLAPLFLLFFSGCVTQPVSRQDLINYISDRSKGLIKSSHHENLDIQLSFKPHDLIVAQEIEGMSYMSNQIDSIKKNVIKFDYFNLSLSKDDHDIISYYGDSFDLDKVMQYLSSGIKDDIKLINGSDTVQVLDVMYMGGFVRKKSTDVLLVFESSLIEKNRSFEIFFNDNFFGTGLSQFDFDIEALKRIPPLKLK
jgi:hypothetical protein